MSKLTVYIPVAYEGALEELNKQGVDKSKLFLDAMLSYLSECPEYTAEPNTLVDVAMRLKRVEAWVVSHQEQHEEAEVEEQPEETIKPPVHINSGTGSAWCGLSGKGSLLTLVSLGELNSKGRLRGQLQDGSTQDVPLSKMCRACMRLGQKAIERSKPKEQSKPKPQFRPEPHPKKIHHADGGQQVALCGSDSKQVFDADELIGLGNEGYPVCQKCIDLSTDV